MIGINHSNHPWKETKEIIESYVKLIYTRDWHQEEIVESFEHLLCKQDNALCFLHYAVKHCYKPKEKESFTINLLAYVYKKNNFELLEKFLNITQLFAQNTDEIKNSDGQKGDFLSTIDMLNVKEFCYIDVKNFPILLKVQINNLSKSKELLTELNWQIYIKYLLFRENGILKYRDILKQENTLIEKKMEQINQLDCKFKTFQYKLPEEYHLFQYLVNEIIKTEELYQKQQEKLSLALFEHHVKLSVISLADCGEKEVLLQQIDQFCPKEELCFNETIDLQGCNEDF